MNASDALLYDTTARALWVLILAILPALIPALVIGLAIGLLQAATSIQEATLTFVPKLVVVLLVLMLFGGITAGLITDFAKEAFSNIPLVAK